MTKEESITRKYFTERAKLEVKEDEIRRFTETGQNLLDEFYSKINFLFSDYTDADMEAKQFALNRFSMFSREFEEKVENESHCLTKSYEQLEERFNKEIRDLSKKE
ncbi:hypothetical protein [Streptococcus parauberis]|uniref:hypothetical protein n=1 Tax=Streptococcus parauberis TaxID=1348 RepID=UPI003798F92D